MNNASADEKAALLNILELLPDDVKAACLASLLVSLDAFLAHFPIEFSKTESARANPSLQGFVTNFCAFLRAKLHGGVVVEPNDDGVNK